MDFESVRAAKLMPWRYAGFVGIARKAILPARVARTGRHPSGKIDSLSAPIGVPVDAETPDELTVSSLAEIISIRRNVSRQEPRTREPSGRGQEIGDEQDEEPLDLGRIFRMFEAAVVFETRMNLREKPGKGSELLVDPKGQGCEFFS